ARTQGRLAALRQDHEARQVARRRQRAGRADRTGTKLDRSVRLRGSEQGGRSGGVDDMSEDVHCDAPLGGIAVGERLEQRLERATADLAKREGGGFRPWPARLYIGDERARDLVVDLDEEATKGRPLGIRESE